MENLKVALLQIIPERSLEQNLEKGITALQTAKELGADIALFPEMWSSGYNIPENIAKLQEMAILPDSEFIRRFSQKAKELDMAVAITFLEKTNALPKNSVIIFDRFGKKALHYSKVHTCDFGDEIRLSAGEDFYVCNIDVGGELVKIGAMICYDREFPESARILMLKGAEIILVPNACPMEINRLSQLRARAFENMVGIATCNYPKGKPDCNGNSSAYDGIIYLPDYPTSLDRELLRAGEDEGIYVADFSIRLLREYRKNEVHGNSYRRPTLYSKLLEEEVYEPFIRDDARR